MSSPETGFPGKKSVFFIRASPPEGIAALSGYRDAGTYAVTLDGETIKTGMTHTNAVAHIVKECQRRGWVQTY